MLVEGVFRETGAEESREEESRALITLNGYRYNPPNVKPCSTIWWPSKASFGRFMQPYALEIIHASRLT